MQQQAYIKQIFLFFFKLQVLEVRQLHLQCGRHAADMGDCFIV